MNVIYKSTMLSLAICLLYFLDYCSYGLNQKVVLISLERPKLTECNPKIARVLNVSSLRHSRSDPVHYNHLLVEYFKPLGTSNYVTLNIYEFLSNEYRPTFVSLRLTICEFYLRYINKAYIYYTKNLSVPLTPEDLGKDCFLKQGIYYFANLSMPISSLPNNFPFQKGRIYLNHTHKEEFVMAGTLDLELKTLPIRKYKGWV